MAETKLRWGVKIDRIDFPRMFSFGMCLSRWEEEVYLYINLLFFSVCIGRMNLEVKNNDN